jgi:hypothetical protein
MFRFLTLQVWHGLTYSISLLPGAGPEERTGVFALCIIRRPSDGKFLMTQEYAGKGRLESGLPTGCRLCCGLHQQSDCTAQSVTRTACQPCIPGEHA